MDDRELDQRFGNIEQGIMSMEVILAHLLKVQGYVIDQNGQIVPIQSTEVGHE